METRMESKNKFSVAFSSDFWAFGPNKSSICSEGTTKLRNQSKLCEADMSPSLIASFHRLCNLCLCWIMKNHTHTDDAQTKHKKSVRLCFCVLWKAPIAQTPHKRTNAQTQNRKFMEFRPFLSEVCAFVRLCLCVCAACHRTLAQTSFFSTRNLILCVLCVCAFFWVCAFSVVTQWSIIS
jgi:hypothetical protein